MFWGQKTIAQFQSDITEESIRKRGMKNILGFNKSDLAAQDNMPVDQAVDAHMAYWNKFSGIARIGSPAVTSKLTERNPRAGPEGLDWLEAFLSLCDQRGCQIDFCGVHWYRHTSEADDMIKFLGLAHRICRGNPI